MNAKYKKQQGGIFMKYIMTGRNVEVTQAMREYAEKKLSRIEKFFNEDTEANVTFSVQKKRHILGVTIFFEGNTYTAGISSFRYRAFCAYQLPGRTIPQSFPPH